MVICLTIGNGQGLIEQQDFLLQAIRWMADEIR
jgi:hypothetical protein